MSSSVPQVEHIWSKAPDEFKNQANVSEFYNHVTNSTVPALNNEDTGETSSQDIDDATIQDILNGK